MGDLHQLQIRRQEMKTVLGIVASPRKFGNSELFVKEIYRQMGDGWQLQLMRLPELSILPCRACYQCLFGDMRCPQDDDFAVALEALVQADALVVAVPTYFLGANASVKRFLDRGLAFYAHLDALWGTPAVGVAIAGIHGMEGYTKLAVDSFLKLVLADHRGSAVLYGALPGEIFLEPAGKDVAGRLAQALLHGKPAPLSEIPCCPVCGGDTFRFLPDGAVRCMLCSGSGSVVSGDQGLQLHIDPGEHQFFVSYASARSHADWLRGMKEMFLARRKELKAVTQGYTQEGTWVRGKGKS
jgi:multimeric flavodoxin WrbA